MMVSLVATMPDRRVTQQVTPEQVPARARALWLLGASSVKVYPMRGVK